MLWKYAPFHTWFKARFSRTTLGIGHQKSPQAACLGRLWACLKTSEQGLAQRSSVLFSTMGAYATIVPILFERFAQINGVVVLVKDTYLFPV